jgi:glycerophosphoryl diester phosphodiesterase
MAAFRLAANLGADAIELDAKLTADGVIVVHHDARLDRTTSGQGPLYARTWDELNGIDAGSKFGEQFAGEPIPTLRQVLEELGNTLLVNIELTNYARPWDALPANAVALVTEMGLEKRVLFSSFNPVALNRVKRMAPEIPAALLLLPQEPLLIRWMLRKTVKHEALHPHERLVDSETTVAREHAMGRMINVWTVNDPKRMSELLSFGVDGLITDFPSNGLAAIRALHSQ